MLEVLYHCAKFGRGSDLAHLWESQNVQFLRHIACKCAACCYGCGMMCVSVCWSQPGGLQKRLNRSRCSLAVGLAEPMR